MKWEPAHSNPSDPNSRALKAHHRWIIVAVVVLCVALIALYAKRARAEGSGAGRPVLVVEDGIAGDLPTMLMPPARVVVYDSGLVVYRPDGSQPVTPESTSIVYDQVRLTPAQYRSLIAELPLGEAYLEPSAAGTGSGQPWILDLLSGREHGQGVEPAGFSQLFNSPGADARQAVYQRLIAFASPDAPSAAAAQPYRPAAYSLRLYPVSESQLTDAPVAEWDTAGLGDIPLPVDARKGLPRTDRRYIETITGDQQARVAALLSAAGATQDVVRIRGALWQLEFTPHLPGDAAWAHNEGENFLYNRDALHGTIADSPNAFGSSVVDAHETAY